MEADLIAQLHYNLDMARFGILALMALNIAQAILVKPRCEHQGKCQPCEDKADKTAHDVWHRGVPIPGCRFCKERE